MVVMEDIGSVLAISGSVLSICGTLINNLWLEHRWAMKVWAISNPILSVWAIGVLLGIWNGGLSILAVLVMYVVFTATNWYGLLRGVEK